MAVYPDKDPLWKISKAEAIRLCRLYEEEMGIMYPMLDLEKLISMASLLFTFTESAGKMGLIAKAKPGDNLGTVDVNILKIVLAIALTIEGTGRSDLGRLLFDSVRGMSESRLWEPSDIKDLTLLVLVVSFSSRLFCPSILIWRQAHYHFHEDEEVRAYRLIGLAARMSLEMGLHRRDILLNTYKDEEDRSWALKLFWSIYVLDRRWSFGTGMPFALQDSDIDTQLPEPVWCNSAFSPNNH